MATTTKKAMGARQPPSKTKKAPAFGLLTEGTKHGQFFHGKAFAQTKGQRRPKKGGGKRTGRKKADIRSIIGELLRPVDQPHFYRHLTSQGIKPMPPIWLGGEGTVQSDKELWSYYEELKEKASAIEHTITPKMGKPYKRKQAKSETILGTAILSWPGKYDPNNPEQAKWIQLCVAWLKEKYGKNLVCIALHQDEPQVHLHCLFDNDGANVKCKLEGPAALDKAEKEGLKGKALRKAHDDAWRAVQDDFHEKVAKHVGLLRKGENPQPRVDMTTAHRNNAKAKEEQADELLAYRKAQAAEIAKKLREGNAARKRGRQMVEDGELTPEQYAVLFGKPFDPFGTGGTSGVGAGGMAPDLPKLPGMPPPRKSQTSTGSSGLLPRK